MDTVPEDQLDQVDVIIFDCQASPRSRREALAFVMDHTEGFQEEEEGNSSPSTSSSSASSSKKSSSLATSVILKRRRVALQLETLTEFAEHHLRDGDLSRVELLAAACLSLPAPRPGRVVCVCICFGISLLFTC